ncbi:c-type cytochrome [Tistrella mobilis]|uniref:Cytochrome C n=1 Tax=Tistrella mobilis (strain KA081020-065) TaxID=1110502 RepID=I3TH14_TISMK|nr:cytochrome c [Tistrella mobilis]AFK52052.1 cytochrome C [Tistrella mobilis KA081020-065]
MTLLTRIGAACALTVTIAAGVAYAQSDVIKERQDGFQTMRKQLGTVKAAVEGGGPADAVIAPAEAMVAYAERIPTLFPAGSDSGDTKALASIWTDRAGFEAAASNFRQAAQELADTGRSGDMDAVAAAFGDVGKACGACHNDYRGK